MAGEESVGRVSVEVVPDASNFGKEAEAELRRQRIDPKDVRVVPIIDANLAALQSQVTAIAESLDRNATIRVHTDFSGIQGIDDFIEDVLPPDGLKVTAGWDPTSEASLRKTLQQLEDAFSVKQVLKVDSDNALEAIEGIRDALQKIEAEKVRIAAEIVLDEELAKQRFADATARMSGQLRLNPRFDFDESSFRAEYQAMVADFRDQELEVQPTITERAKNVLRRSLDGVKVGVDTVLRAPNVAVARAMIDAQLARIRGTVNAVIEVSTGGDLKANVDAITARLRPVVEVGLRVGNAAQAAYNAAMAKLTAPRSVSIVPDLLKVGQAAVSASLAVLSRDRVVNFYVRMGSSLADVASVLSGFDALQKSIGQARQALTGLFTNLPQFAAATTAVFGLSGALLSSAANMVGLAGSAAQAIPILLALPGIAIGIGVMAAALKDFSSELPGVVSQLQTLQPLISSSFWGQARAGVQELADAIMGPLQTGLAGTSTAIGTFMGSLASNLATAIGGAGGPLELWFADLQASVAAFSAYIPNLISIFVQFGEVGSAMLVPLAELVGSLTERFDVWFGSLVAGAGGVDAFASQTVGALASIIETVIQLGGIFGAVFSAAQTSGAMTFEGLAQTFAGWAETLKGDEAQAEMVALFDAAQQMWSNFTDTAGGSVQAAMENISTLLQAVLPVVGSIMGTVTDLLAGIVTPEAVEGLSAFVDGIMAGVEAMRPAFAPLSDLIASLGPVLGQLATTIGSVFGALAPSVTGVVTALAPLIETLGSGLVTVIQAVQPAIEQFANALSTALADPALTDAINAIVGALVALAPALTPIIGLAASLVSALMPIVAAVLQPLAGLIQLIVPLFTPLAAVIAGLVQAILPLVPILLNLVTAVLEPILPLIVALVSSLLPPLIPIIQLLAGVIQLVMALLLPLVEAVLPLLAGVLTVIVNVIGLVAAAISGVFAAAIGWIQEQITTVSAGISAFFDKWQEIWNNVADFFKGLWEGLLNWIKDLLGIHSPSTWFLDLAENMLQGMLDGLKAGWEWITGFFGGAWNWLKEKWTEAFENVKTTVLNAWEAIKGFFVDAWNNLKITVTDGWNSIKTFFTDGATSIKTTVTEAWDRVKSFFTEGVTNAVNTMKDLPGKVVSALGNLGSTLWQAGRDLVQGLLNGIGSLASSIGSWFLNKIPGWIREPFKAALGINSPSTVFFEFGQNIVDGLIEGMESKHRKVFSSLDGLASGMSETQFNLPNVTSGGIAAVAQMVAAATSGTASRVLNYYAAPGSGLSSEEDLFAAAGRGRMVW